MPRRPRRRNGADTHSGLPPPKDKATSKEIPVALQEPHEIRCDISNTTNRTILQGSEFVALHSEHQQCLAMHDKIEALSRRFTCQNEAIDEEMREDIVHCFNAAMMEATEKLIRQTISREQRNRYIHNLHNILADLRECYEIRQEHFEQQIYVKHLEKHLAMARRHELEKTHKVTSEQLSEVLHLVSIAQNHHDDLSAKLKECRDTIIEGQRVLESSEKLYETQKTQIEEARGRVKDMQISNSAKRKTNKATIIHINAMEAECKRLELAICECRDEERKERTKAEALEKLYKQITCDVESAEQDADHARGLHKSQAGNQGPEPDGQ